MAHIDSTTTNCSAQGTARKENNTIGSRIRELRMQRRMSQVQLSMKLNTSSSTICGYEKNRYLPDLMTLCRIADFFHVSMDYLVGRSNDLGTDMDIIGRNFIARVQELYLEYHPEHEAR